MKTKTIVLSVKKIIKMIKWCLLELLTNTSIDHRNYNYTSKPLVSPLVE